MTQIQNSKRLSPSQVKPRNFLRPAMMASTPADLISRKAVIQLQ